jgi:hypothetical protein
MIVGDLKCWIEILKNNDNEKGKHLPFDNYIDGSKRNSMWIGFCTLQKGTVVFNFLLRQKTSGIPLCNNKYQICVLIYQILTPYSQNWDVFMSIWLFLFKRRIPNIIHYLLKKKSLHTRVFVYLNKKQNVVLL